MLAMHLTLSTHVHLLLHRSSLAIDGFDEAVKFSSSFFLVLVDSFHALHDTVSEFIEGARKARDGNGDPGIEYSYGPVDVYPNNCQHHRQKDVVKGSGYY